MAKSPVRIRTFLVVGDGEIGARITVEIEDRQDKPRTSTPTAVAAFLRF